MKRSLTAIIAAATLLAACGASDDAETTSDTNEAAAAMSASDSGSTATVAITATSEPTPTGADTTAPVTTGTALEATEPVTTGAAPEATALAAPTTVEVGSPDGSEDESGAGGLSAAEQAAADAWSIVFDSTVGFEEKRPHLADASALQPTIDSYTAAGAGFGGISLVPTAVAVDGDSAEITYDVNFGENPAYSDQTGSVELVDGVWTVSRDEFCGFMSSARVERP